MPLASAIELPERYRVTRHIASGGMATVWEVEDLLLGRIVAVKVLGSHFAADPGARARFQREARTAARVSEHPHIATIYDTGEHADNTFIVMEYFSGGTVADRVRAAKDGGKPVPRETALRWLREAALALDAAHAADIVHRDVKPANLLIDANDRLAVGVRSPRSISSTSATAVRGRSWGSFARPRAKTTSIAAGSSGAASVAFSGSSSTCWRACAVTGPPAKGRCPVSSS